MSAWSFACPDWAARLEQGRSLMPALPLDEREAARAVAIFDRLRLYDVPGTPSMAEAAGDWLRDVVRAIHGSLDSVTNTRRVPGVFLLVPKKNNKTTGGGLFMLASLLMNRRPNAQFALFGPSQRTAQDAYNAAAGAVLLDPDLRKVIRLRDHLKQITYRPTGATLEIATFDPAIATGKKFAGWLLDELHELDRDPNAAKVLTQMRGASAAITEQFGLIITTQADDPPAGVFKAELDYARAVRDGRIASPKILPLLYEFPEALQVDRAAPWRDPALWTRVNPNLGRSVSLEKLIELHQEARDKGEDEERVWASQHLNIQIGLGAFDGSWPGAAYWLTAARAGITLETIIAECEVACVGIDGGGLDDLLGVYVIGRTPEGKWLGWGHAFADRGVLKLRKEIAPRLLDLAKAGELTLVDIGDAEDSAADEGRAEPSSPSLLAGEEEGPRQGPPLHDLPEDVAGVAAIVARLFEAGLLPEKAGIGVDAVGVAAIGDAIEALGVPPECIVAVPQGYRLSGVIKGAARKLKDKSFVPSDQPLMRFAVANAKQERRGNAVLITKQVSGSAKIDPLIAMLNAFDLISRSPEGSGGPSVYEQRGIMVV